MKSSSHTPKVGELWAWTWAEMYPKFGGTVEYLMVLDIKYLEDDYDCEGVCLNIETQSEDVWSFSNSGVGTWKKVSAV